MNIAVAHQSTQAKALHSPMNAYKEIYQQFVNDASFLWILRSVAIEQPHYNSASIAELEQRIESQINGLMISIDASWSLCLEGLELEEPGEVFTSTVIAFRCHDATKIQKVIEVGLSNENASKGLISAMGWLPDKLVHPWLKKFFTSKDLNHKYLALAACSVRRENPGEYLNKILERDDCKQHEKLYARAIRLIGEIRRQDLMPCLTEAINSEQDNIRFWATYSSILLGNHAAVTNLKPYVFQQGPNQTRAIHLAFKVLPVEQARNWISELVTDTEQNRTVIKATGILGDPHAVNWLITKMQEPEQAKLAAESFTLITGIDLEQYQLIDDAPPAISQQPNDSDENVTLDEDENLAYPDQQKVTTIWVNHGQNFIAGQRYFMGKTISVEWLKNKRTNGTQRQRHLADLELSLLGDTPLHNSRAKIPS